MIYHAWPECPNATTNTIQVDASLGICIPVYSPRSALKCTAISSGDAKFARRKWFQRLKWPASVLWLGPSSMSRSHWPSDGRATNMSAIRCITPYTLCATIPPVMARRILSSKRLARVEGIAHRLADEDQQRQHDGHGEEACQS